MARKYHTLLTREDDGKWHIAFGDYDRQVVVDEKEGYRDGYPGYKAKDLKIITTGDRQADIAREVAMLNAEEAK